MANKNNSKTQNNSKKENTQVITPAKAETKKVNPIEAITAKIPALAKTGKATSSIYKAELFDGQDDKGKKAIRRKVRRIRDQFLGAFLEAKNKPEVLNGLQKDWMEFASQVYNNAQFIFEKNTSEEDQKLCQDFVKAMAALTK